MIDRNNIEDIVIELISSLSDFFMSLSDVYIISVFLPILPILPIVLPLLILYYFYNISHIIIMSPKGRLIKYLNLFIPVGFFICGVLFIHVGGILLGFVGIVISIVFFIWELRRGNLPFGRNLSNTSPVNRNDGDI